MIVPHMPHLAAFQRSHAVSFTRERSVFPSLTRMATTALSTGCWPRRHGIVGNAFHMPDVMTGLAVDTSRLADLLRTQAMLSHVTTAPSLGARLAAGGRRLGVVHAGSAGSAFLLNPDAASDGHWTFSIHGPEHTLTPDATTRAIDALGDLPHETAPKLATVDYAAEVAIRHGLAPDGPDVVWVWLPEPDTSFHYRLLSSEETRAAMARADSAFGRIVDAALSGPRGARTAVLALSDHGQITTTDAFDIEAALRADGFAAATSPTAGDTIGLTRGAMGEIRLLDADRGVLRELAQWLTGRVEIGMVFARDDVLTEVPGALPLSLVHLDHARSPELVYVMRSDDLADAHGLLGRGLLTGGITVGGGMHGGLNAREMATVLSVAAPGCAAGEHDDRPCGIIDVTPTILSLLGLRATDMDGHPLPLDGSAAPAWHTDTHRARGVLFSRAHAAYHCRSGISELRRSDQRARDHSGGTGYGPAAAWRLRHDATSKLSGCSAA